MPTSRGTGKKIAELFYECDSNDSTFYICRCGDRHKKSGTSYTNLVSHFVTSHPNYINLLDSSDGLSQAHLEKYFMLLKSGNIYGWMGLIINGLLPFSAAESKVFRRNVKHDAPCLETFMKYMSLLTEVVENKISSFLPLKFTLVFDGWSHNSTHYLAVFASYPAPTEKGYAVRLLTVSPLIDESNLSAKEHEEFMSFVPSIYGKPWDNVVCLVGDNVSTNKSLARRLGLPFVGCRSHRFNLAVKDVLQGDEAL